jgi:hypothetical protein
MASYAVAFGALLIGLGAWGYLGAEEVHRSVTALIPAFVGLPLLLLGFLAFKEKMRKHAMHAAAAIGLLGFVAAAARLIIVLAGAAGASRHGLALRGLRRTVCQLLHRRPTRPARAFGRRPVPVSSSAPSVPERPS